MAKQNLIPINSGVYCLTCKANGLIYVGSSRNIKLRFKRHKRDLRLGIHPSKEMLRDFRAYGQESFSIKILESVYEPGADLLVFEQKWLDRLRPYDSAIGYNTSPISHAFGGPRSEETKQKMSAAALRRPPEHYAKVSASLTGREVTCGDAISAGRKASAKAKAAIAVHNADKRVLSDDDVRRIRSFGKSGKQQVAIAAEFGVSRRVIRAILGGETYREVI